MRLMIAFVAMASVVSTAAVQAQSHATDLQRDLAGTEDGVGDLSELHALRNLAVVTVEAQSTSLERPVEGEVADSRYESGIQAPPFEHGLYVTRCSVLDPLYGVKELPETVKVGPYPTFESGWQPHGWAVSPPFQEDEQFVIILEMHPLHGALWRYDWRYLMPDHPTAARRGTPTFEEDLRLITAIGQTLDAEPENQWRFVSDYATGSDDKLSTWAVDMLSQELARTEPDSANHKEAKQILKTIAASPHALDERARIMILQRLQNIPSVREEWMTFVARLARGDYKQRANAWKMLAQLEGTMLQALQRGDSDEVVEQLYQIYAMALANRSIPVEQREIRVRNLAEEQQRNLGLTDNVLFKILFEVVRQSDEPTLEAACVETIRDNIPLTAEQRHELRQSRDLITSPRARTILNGLLNS